MRADRLVSVLLLLQSRGTVTAAEVAVELEVSERTARRDLDALSVAGVPVYSRQGRGGGWTLVGGARTDLTGLRSAEARALLTMAVASGRATPEFSSAMRKLSQALPEPIRLETERVMRSVMSDETTWTNRDGSLLVDARRDDWLDPIQEAVAASCRVAMTYDTPRRGRSTRLVEPLGLVVKHGVWYLLADTDQGRRSFRVDRIAAWDATDQPFEPPTDFDLEAAWADVTLAYAERSTRASVGAVVDDAILPSLRALGVETIVHGPASSDHGVDRSVVTLGAWNVSVLAAQIAGLAHAIDLTDPPDELTARLAEIGRGLVERHGVTSRSVSQR